MPTKVFRVPLCFRSASAALSIGWGLFAPGVLASTQSKQQSWPEETAVVILNHQSLLTSSYLFSGKHLSSSDLLITFEFCSLEGMEYIHFRLLHASLHKSCINICFRYVLDSAQNKFPRSLWGPDNLIFLEQFAASQKVMHLMEGQGSTTPPNQPTWLPNVRYDPKWSPYRDLFQNIVPVITTAALSKGELWGIALLGCPASAQKPASATVVLLIRECKCSDT